MTPLINIHTATENAIVNLVVDGKLVDSRENADTRDHGKFLHLAIEDLLREHGIQTRELQAIGVTQGPGSYTGIRVGLASASGLAFALRIPMIFLSALELLAGEAKQADPVFQGRFCPMIDARRMEVYTSMYDSKLLELMPPQAMILHHDSFAEVLQAEKVHFFGSGAEKFQQVCTSPHAGFSQVKITSEGLAALSWKKFGEGKVEIRPYAIPLYIKDFHSAPPSGS